MKNAQAFARAAERLVGTTFRLYGRDPQTGLDCVGLVITALTATGRRVVDPAGYQLRNSSIDRWLGLMGEAGFAPAHASLEPGDVAIVVAGPAQHHLLIASQANTFVHVHAGLRRVVCQPGPLPWPVHSRWRLIEQD